MKKIVAFLMIACFVLVFASCKTTEENVASDTDAETEVQTVNSFPETLADLYENGFYHSQSSYADNEIKILFEKNGVYIMVCAEMNDEKLEEYNSLDTEAEDYSEKLEEFYLSLENAKLTDISDFVPTSAELASMVGKTLGELEDEGFEQSSYSFGDETCSFVYVNDVYACKLTVAQWDSSMDFDSLTPEDIREFKISDASFSGFSWDMFNREY